MCVCVHMFVGAHVFCIFEQCQAWIPTYLPKMCVMIVFMWLTGTLALRALSHTKNKHQNNYGTHVDELPQPPRVFPPSSPFYS